MSLAHRLSVSVHAARPAGVTVPGASVPGPGLPVPGPGARRWPRTTEALRLATCVCGGERCSAAAAKGCEPRNETEPGPRYRMVSPVPAAAAANC